MLNIYRYPRNKNSILKVEKFNLILWHVSKTARHRLQSAVNQIVWRQSQS